MSEVERRRTVGRYTVYGAIASGGMASVHLGRLQGTAGFSRTVAIKRLHPGLANDSQLVTMLLDEARTSARIQHPNVVSTLDVVEDGGEVLLVLEYVHGESLANLLGGAKAREGALAPSVPVVAAIVAGALRGLHAAHEAKDERGVPLELVHRDVSPQNILVDTNGNARLLDFGVAKAYGRQQVSQVGILKGKVAYMAPEQIHGSVSRRSDIFSMGIVLWEALTGERLFQGKSDGEILAAVLMAKAPPARSKAKGVPEALDEVLLRSLRRLPEDRFATALDFAQAIEASVTVAPARAVADWLLERAGETLARREQLLLAEESAAAPAAGASFWRTGSRLRPRALIAIAIGVAAAASMSLGLLAARSARHAPAPAPSAAPSAAALAVSAPSLPDPAPSTAAAEPDDGEPVPADEPASPRPAEPRPRATQAPRGRCDPPYTLDSKGRKMYKRYCF